MRWIARPRQTGKTTALIEWAQQEKLGGPPRYIVVATQQEANRVFNQSRDENGNQTIRLPITFDEVVRYGGYPARFAIDNIDLILQWLVRGSIEMVTYTDDEQR